MSSGAKADMHWFMDFLPLYNGISIIPDAAPSAIIEADSCLMGGGAVRAARCFWVEYDRDTSERHHISQLEAMNCLAAIRVMISGNDKGG